MAFRNITIRFADGRVVTKRVDEKGIVPKGGTTGQVLVKLTDDDYNVDWGTTGSGALTGDEIDAIHGANDPSVYNVFATMADIGIPLSTDIINALENANMPSISNVFATMADIGGASEFTGDEIDAIHGANAPSVYNVFATMAEIDGIQDVFDDFGNPWGFVNSDNSETTLSFDELNRRITITPVGATFEYYIAGRHYVVTGAKSVDIPDDEGVHIIYINAAGTLFSTQSFSVAIDYAVVAAVYWDDTNNKFIYESNERHTTGLTHDDWAYKHLTFGTQWRSGASLSAITADGSGDLNSHATFTADAGVIDDEDIRHTLSSQTTFDIFYRLGAAGDWRRASVASAYGVYFDGTRAAWNEFTGGAWQLTTVGNLNFVLAHVFATNNILSPYIVIMGQNDYGSITSARVGATVEMNDLITNGLPFQEFVAAASIIYQTSNGYANSVKSRIRTTDAGANYVNWLGQNISPSTNPTSHNNLLGLQGGAAGEYYHLSSAEYTALTGDIYDALVGADVPSVYNVFATMADLPAGTTINNNANNRVITGSGTANTLEGETNLTFDGSTLTVTGNARITGLGGTPGLYVMTDFDGDLSASALPTASTTQQGIIEIATTIECQDGVDTSRAVTPAGITDWAAVRGASTTARGLIEIATDAEVQLGLSVEYAVTPAGLSSRTATETRTGIVELATNAETQTGTDTERAITPANLTSRTATETRTGIVELATVAEAQAGTDTTRAVTAAGVAGYCPAASETVAGKIEIATSAEVIAGTDNTRVVTPAGLQALTALDTRAGIVELATDAETQTGTDTARAITPANLTARTATETRTGIAELATQVETDAGVDDARIVTPLKLKNCSFIGGGGITMINGVNNRVTTATGASEINGEANLTFDGSLLTVTGNTRITGVIATGETKYIISDADGDLSVAALPASSETVVGIVELATDAETQTGTDTARAITPANLTSRTATETRTGVIELATTVEAAAGTDTTRAVTAAGLAAYCPAASETVAGKIEIATQAEVTTGTDDVRAITPLKLATAVPAATETAAGKIEIATSAEVTTGTDNTRAVTPAGLQSMTATDARDGIVELATDAETQTGTDTTRAITPANLTARTATETRTGVIELATQAEVDAGTDAVRAVTPATLASHIGSKEGYAVSFGTVTTFSPADNAVYAIGQLTIGTPGTTFNTIEKLTMPKLGTITACAINWYAGTVAGSTENISVSIRLNNTTDYLVQTVGNTAASKIFANYTMSVPIASGSVIELKVACPAWATNPTAVRIRGWAYVEV